MNNDVQWESERMSLPWSRLGVIPLVLALGVTPASFLTATSAVAGPAEPGCPAEGALVNLAEVAAFLDGSLCDLTGIGITGIATVDSKVQDEGPIIWVPGKGHGAGSYRYGVDGEDSFRVVHDSVNRVGIEVNDVQVGDVDAFREFTASGKTDPGAPQPTSSAPTINLTSSVARLTDLPGSHNSTRCAVRSNGYRKLGSIWQQPYKWWYNATSSQGSGSIDRIKGAMGTWNNGNTDCANDVDTLFTGEYQTGGEANNYTSGISSSGGCPGGQRGHSVVDWGSLSGSTLAWTCTFVVGPVLTEADVKIASNSSTKEMYRGSSPSGCSGSLYDLQNVITHEFGHAAGLKHTVNETGTAASNYWQTMKPSQGFCDTEGRWLGYGDAAGLLDMY